VSGSDLFVANSGSNTVGEYDAGTGAAVTVTCTSTSLSGAGQSGTRISVPASVPVTDSATLAGDNASNAGGTVIYTVYSDAACTNAVSTGTPEPITVPGTLPASSPVTLAALGTYYWQATYSAGDGLNGTSASTCGTGGEVETVGFKITTSSLPSATPGVSYGRVTLQTAGAGTSTSPYRTTLKWKKVSLPKGLKLSKKTGVLSGTPSKKLTGGTSSVKVQVTETVTTRNGKKRVKTKTTVQATIPLTIT
jgi:hypothetical protein